MSTLLVPWLLFPLVLAALSLGCGLLLERGSGLRLPGALLLPIGLAVLIIVALIFTMNGATALLTSPAVVIVAVVGYSLALQRGWRPRLDWWAAGAALAVYAVYAAPVVLSGKATFPGFIKLDDDSTFMTNLDRLMHHGRNISGLAPSTYLATLAPHLAKGYPMGSVIPIGVGRELVGGDVLWLYQPCLAFMAAMLALSIYQLTAPVIKERWLRGLAAFVGSQSALLYGYAQWGGLKETAGAWLIALTAVLAVPVLRGRMNPRALLPLAASAAALLGVLSAGAGVWLAPVFVAALAALVLIHGSAATVRPVAAFAVLLAALALPTIIVSPTFAANKIYTFDYLANLVRPLNAAQIVGIWPTGDFRYDPARWSATVALIAITAIAAAGGVLWGLYRRAWEVPVYVVGAVVSCFAFFIFSTPWIDGKALASAAPAVPVAALIACAPLRARGLRLEAALLATVITGGVLWSTVLQYHEVWLAPRGQLGELQWVGNHFAGDGPTLMTEYEPYGVRHFLRKMDGEGASELRIRPVPLRNGQLLGKGAYANIDDFQLDAVLVYRSLVLRRSPAESRPPSIYRLVWKGKWYEVWQRPVSGGATIVQHVSLGNDQQPAAVPSCTSVQELAQTAGLHGLLATVQRPPAVVTALSSGSVPRGWGVDQSGNVIPAGAGTLQVAAKVPKTGRYSVWIGGSFRDRLDVFVDGQRVGSENDQLNNAGQYNPFSLVHLSVGTHQVTLRYSGSSWRPGSAGPQFGLGPLVLSTTTADLPVKYVKPANALSLCGKNLDWVEAVSG